MTSKKSSKRQTSGTTSHPVKRRKAGGPERPGGGLEVAAVLEERIDAEGRMGMAAVLVTRLEGRGASREDVEVLSAERSAPSPVLARPPAA